MKDTDKAKQQLIAELAELRQRIIELETLETSRQPAAERLQLLSSAVEQSTEGIAVSDLAGNLLFVNNAFAAMHGYTSEELVGEHLSIFHTPEQMPSVEAANRQIREIGLFSGEIWHVRRDGTVFPTLMYNSLLRDEAGAAIGMIGTARDNTERKQAEEALQESEERYRTLVEQSLQGIFIAQGPPFRLVFVNPAAARIWGYTPEELMRLSPEETFGLLHPEDRTVALQRIVDVREEKPLPPQEYRLIHKDGTVRLVEIFGRRIEYQGETAFQVAVLDITGRRRAEEDLLVKEYAISSAINGVAIAGFGGSLTYVNRAFLRLWGYEDENEVLGQPAVSFWQSEERAAQVVEALRESDGWVGELVAKRKDGSLFDVHLSASVVRDETGNPICMMSSFLDVTERKRMADALQRSERYYRGLFENAHDAIIVFEPEGEVILDVNQRACEMYGFDRSEFIGMSLEAISKEISRGKRMIEEVLDTKGGFNFETVQCRKDGTEMLLDVRATVVSYEGQRAILSINRDVTERKQAEESLQRSKDQLELLYRLSRRLSESLELHDVAQWALDDVCAVVGALRGILLVRELDSDHLRLVAISGYDAESVEALNRRVGAKTGKGLAGWVAVHQQPALVDDVTRDERWLLVPGLDDWVRAALSVPLVSQDELVGVLSIYSEQESFFHEDHRRLVESAAAAVAAAVTNARLYAQAQQQLQSLTNLNRASQVITSSLDMDEVLAQIVDLTGSVVNSDYTSVALLDEEGKPVLGAEDFRGVPPLTRRIRSGGTTRHVLDSGQTVVVDVISAEGVMSPPFPGAGGESMTANPAIVAAGIRSFAAVPIQAKDKTLGVLFVHSREPHTFHGQLPLLTTFANQAAVAIENAQLYEQAQQDIAERKRAEEALRESVLQYRTTIDSMGDSIHVVDTDLQIVLVNQALSQWIESLGLSTDVVGRNVFGVFPFLSEEIRDEYHQVFDSGETLITEESTKIEGGEFVTETRKIPILEGGKAARVVTAIRDITERKQAEEERTRLLTQIQEQARQVQQIVDTVPEGVLLLDADARILLANPAAREYLLVLTDAQVGDRLTHLGDRSLAELLARPPEGLWHEVSVGQAVRQAFEVIAQPMTPGPEARGWVLVMRDITREREIQKWVQQQERLAAVGQLAAGIAHDFNNLLTGMIGFAQLSQIREDVPDSVKADLARIVQEGRRATRLIRQILDFSRKSLRTPQLLDLAPFLTETAKFLERTIPENIHIVLEMTPGGHLIFADPTQIQQLLTNLAVNARDAMPEGGELRLRLSGFILQPGEHTPLPDMSPGEWVALAVTDTGTGIPPEVMAHLYEPFFTTKEVGEGTGLGLAQVYGIVKQHEGYIDVESQVGVGTTFTIYLPAVRLREEVVPKTPEAIPEGQGETILLVEDEAMVLDVIQAMLKRLRYRVLTATNGQEALAVYEQHHDEIDLVLMDLIMPEMNGEVLFQALRERDPEVKVVVMTGYPLKGKYKQLLTQEAIDWILKPMEHAQLARVLRCALE